MGPDRKKIIDLPGEQVNDISSRNSILCSSSQQLSCLCLRPLRSVVSSQKALDLPRCVFLPDRQILGHLQVCCARAWRAQDTVKNNGCNFCLCVFRKRTCFLLPWPPLPPPPFKTPLLQAVWFVLVKQISSFLTFRKTPPQSRPKARLFDITNFWDSARYRPTYIFLLFQEYHFRMNIVVSELSLERGFFLGTTLKGKFLVK